MFEHWEFLLKIVTCVLSRKKTLVLCIWEAHFLNYCFHLISMKLLLKFDIWFWWHRVAPSTSEQHRARSLLTYLILKSSEQLRKDAANAPHVYCKIILLFNHNNLRRPVPPRNNMLRKLSFFLLPNLSSGIKNLWDLLSSTLRLFLFLRCLNELTWFGTSSCQSKITDGRHASTVNEDVRRLNISMYYVTLMQKVNRA